MRNVILATALGALAACGSHAAFAFTVESHGSMQSGGSAKVQSNAGAAGYLDMDASSLLPPMGEPVSGSSFDFSPRSFNNGLASQPSRGGSVGPGWLYPPR